MTLFYVLTNNFELWPDAYECPANVTVPDVRWPRFGVYLMTSGSIFLTLYFLCFLAIIKIKSSSPNYQLMFIIAIFDIMALTLGSLIFGYLAYHGTFFCTYPLFFFITGSLSLFTWFTNCIGCILLAIERCSEVDPKFFLSFLFGKRVFLVVKICYMLYSIIALLFLKPVIFSPVYSSLIYDPLIGKNPNLYTNSWVVWNNFMMAVSTTTLYIYLCYYFLCKYGYSTSSWLYKSKRQIILQGVFLCFFHSASAIIYEYMHFFSSPLPVVVAGQITWQISCGCLSIVYLTLNRTIRNTVIKMVIPKRIRLYFGWHIGVEEHLAVEHGTSGAAVINAGGSVIKFDNYFPN